MRTCKSKVIKMNLKRYVLSVLLTSLVILLVSPVALADLNVIETPPADAGTVPVGGTLTLTFKISYSGSTDSRAAISIGFDPSGWTYAGFTATMDAVDVSAGFAETVLAGSVSLTNDALEPDEGTLTVTLIFTATAEGTYTFDWSSAFSIISGTNPDIKTAMDTTRATVSVGWIEGTVTDADTGLPIEGATVSANGYSHVTGPLGFYSLEVSPGTYDVAAKMTGYEPQTVMGVEVAADKTVTQDFRLSPAAPPVGGFHILTPLDTIKEFAPWIALALVAAAFITVSAKTRKGRISWKGLKSGYKALIAITLVLLAMLSVESAWAGVSDVSAPSGTMTVYQTFPLTLNFTATLSGSAPRAAVISSNIPEGWAYLGYYATLDEVPITFVETIGAASVSWENETMGEGTMMLLAYLKAPFDLGDYAFSGAYAYRAGGAIQPGTWQMTAQVVQYPSDANVTELPPAEIWVKWTPPTTLVSLSFEANLTGLGCRAVVSSSIPENCSYRGYEAYMDGASITFSKTSVDSSVTLENASLGYIDPLCGNLWAKGLNLSLTFWLNFTEAGDYDVAGLYVFAGGDAIVSGEWSTTVHVVPITLDVSVSLGLITPTIDGPLPYYGCIIPINCTVSNPGVDYFNIKLNVVVMLNDTVVWEINVTRDFLAGTTVVLIDWDTLDCGIPNNYELARGNVTVVGRLFTVEEEVLAEDTYYSTEDGWTLLPTNRDILWERVVDIILDWPEATPDERDELWDILVKIIIIWPTVPS